MQPLVKKAFGSFLKQTATQFSDRPAIRCSGATWSYYQLDQYTDQLAFGLLSVGVQRGSHVAIWAETSPNYIFFFCALQKIGAVAVLLNPGLHAEEISELLNLADVEFLAIGEKWKDICIHNEILKIFPIAKIRNIFTMGENKKDIHPYESIDIATLVDLGNMYGEREKSTAIEKVIQHVHVDDPALILFTSGSTQRLPKAVLFSQYHLTNGGIQKADELTATEQDVFCCVLPLYHIFGLDVNLFAAFSCGACLALPSSSHTEEILQVIQEEHCTILSAVPSIFLSIIGHKSLKRYDLSTLRTGLIAGAYCAPETFCQIEHTIGGSFILLSGLGQTEIAAGISISSVSDPLQIRSTTLGKFVPAIEGRIEDLQTRDVCQQGKIGEICVNSSLLMTGYYPLESERTAFQNGWLRTGDLGWLDQDEYLHYFDRLKDIINRGGEKISPKEIENALKENILICAVKVIGVPDTHYGEEICACIVPKYPTLTAENILEQLRSKLARFKIPKYILFFEHLPMTETGKIRKQELKEMAILRIQEQQVCH